MDDAIPSISTGAVGSRFVSQNDIDSAKAKRDEQWKAAYARLGQEPPPQPVEDVYDGRSLAEKLAANKAAKQEEWEEKTKLELRQSAISANQFRALEEDEIMFLDSIMEKQRQEELERQQQDAVDVKGFKQAVAAKNNAAQQPPVPITSSKALTNDKPSQPSNAKDLQKTTAIKKAPKSVLKGVIVKKKKPSAPSSSSPSTQAAVDAKRDRTEDKDEPAKRRKVSQSSSDVA